MTLPPIDPPQSDPALVLRPRDRQFAADMLAVAILGFDLFRVIEERRGMSENGLRDQFGFAARPLDVLLTLCRASGFIRTDDGGVCRLTRCGSEHLVSSSPWFLGPYYEPIRDTQTYRDFVSVLKTDRPGHWQGDSAASDWHESMKDPTFAKSFTDLMNCRGLAFAQSMQSHLHTRLNDRKHLLDVGGGSGIYASVLARANRSLRATVLEQSPVDAIARQEITRYGLDDRVDVVAADMFDGDWPACDTMLMSNLLHDWGVEKNAELLSYAAKSVCTGGQLIIHGAIVDDDKHGPLPVAEYSALLVNITQGKCYSGQEYSAMVADAGFETIEVQRTIGDRGYVLAIKR